MKRQNTRGSKLARPRKTSAARPKKGISRKRQNQRGRKAPVVKGAQNRLKGFRQASILAVAITGFILLIFSTDDTYSMEGQEDMQQDTLITATETDTTSTVQGTEQATGEAIGALQDMWNSFIVNYPKILIAFGVLILSWMLIWLIKFLLRRIFRKLKSLEGVVTLTSIVLWLLAVGITFSVVAGDIRALIGSFGLIGLALSWALQTPIESFTGWLMNAFRQYYKVGDRILVGEVFGDVYRIDFLSTTVWEIGSPYQAGFVSAEQPTGRMVTFPNNEILTGTVVNLTGDFPYVWDELDIAVANESDLPLAMRVLDNVATEVIGEYMQIPAQNYSVLLKKAGLQEEVPVKPQIFLAQRDSWTDIIVRYLVGARERRRWKTELLLKTTAELNKPEYKNKIIPAYPRQQLQIIDANGLPSEPLKDEE